VVSRVFRRQLHDPSVDQHQAIRSGQLFVSVQIATDLLLLTGILALTGGVENPMAVFYLFHMAISGLLLRTWQAAIQASWTVLLYGLMCVGQVQGWLPHDPFLPHLGQAGLHDEPHHVFMVFSVITLAVFGTLYFMDRIGKVLDHRQDTLIRMYEALEQSQEAIHDLQHRRSRFMQTAAHQLKSPLAMVQTLANLIRDEIVTAPKDIKVTCDKIVRRSREGIQQVTELLALARVQEADPCRHQTSKLNVGPVVEELCKKHAPVAEERHLALSWDIPASDDLTAYVDRADLVDCVGNLIENAIKYTPDNGRVEVTVVSGRQAPEDPRLPQPPAGPGRAASVADFVYIIVRDTGIGLGEPVATKGGTSQTSSVFDAFRRGNTALALGIPGTGLGLSIVREVVEQAGGYIHVWSRPGKGSTFTVCFPVEPSRAPTTVRSTRASNIVIEGNDGAVVDAADEGVPVSPGAGSERQA
jgi:signal transduction histidine kinase